MTPAVVKDELKHLDPEPVVITLLDGETQVKILPLKTRQLLKLLRVFTRGASAVLDQIDFSGPADVIVGRLVGLVIFAIPEAEDETIDFLQSVIEPVLSTTLNQQDMLGARVKFWESMANPEIEDTLNIIEAVIESERDNLVSLGKRIQGMVKVAQKVGEL